jgi:hypothetical protein
MSVLFGGDATGYAIQLGKALSDPEKGLASLKKTGALTRAEIERIGGEFARTGNKGQAFTDIIGAINRQVSGQSEAVARSSEKIKVSLGQVIESFAKPFSEGFNALPAALESVFPAVSAKATELGTIVGTSIAMAISGDSSRLVEIGKSIGVVIAQSINFGIQEGRIELGNIMSDTILNNVPFMKSLMNLFEPLIAGSQPAIDKFVGSGKNTSKNPLVDFNNAMQNLRAGMTVIIGPTGDKFRPAFAGEQSIFQDSSGNKIVPLLEKIVNNTTANPFPAK